MASSESSEPGSHILDLPAPQSLESDTVSVAGNDPRNQAVRRWIEVPNSWEDNSRSSDPKRVRFAAAPTRKLNFQSILRRELFVPLGKLQSALIGGLRFLLHALRLVSNRQVEQRSGIVWL